MIVPRRPTAQTSWGPLPWMAARDSEVLLSARTHSTSRRPPHAQHTSRSRVPTLWLNVRTSISPRSPASQLRVRYPASVGAGDPQSPLGQRGELLGDVLEHRGERLGRGGGGLTRARPLARGEDLSLVPSH